VEKNNPLYAGCHISASGGYMAMGRRAARLGATTFAFFTRNPRGGAAAAADPADAQKLMAFAAEHGFGPLVAHAPYTLNPCSDKENVREFARLVFDEDLRRMELTPGQFYNFHPGSHMGQGAETGVEMIAALLNEVLWPDMTTTVLLETMAGKGSEIGGSFEELRAILSRVELSGHMGVCLDTCHIWDAGYDVENWDSVLEEFDRVIGLERLRAVHMNNSLNPRGARKDRHARLLEGCIAPDAFGRILRHPAMAGIPVVLETPQDEAGYAAEIAWLREAYNAKTTPKSGFM